VNAIMMGWGGVGSYKLYEVSTYHVELPLGASSSIIFMERKKYAALPAAARKVLDDKTGEATSRALGAFTDKDGAATRDHVKAMAGQTVLSPTPAQYKEMETKLAPI